ncbi:MAG: hypothetical protein DYG98_04640 [Haliscomenobacteraceae bacterium CHB4]|nr:hypothetical protein [Haliscomenobacteraceae bacterium CHB4]
MKENGGETKRSGRSLIRFETFHEIIYGKSDAAQTSAAFFLCLLQVGRKSVPPGYTRRNGFPAYTA